MTTNAPQSPQSATADAVIVGGGHNGLVCAFYLARAGLKVTVLERRHVLGGAAVTEEFFPGFRNSTASYTVSLLNPKVIADMQLGRHGLRVVHRRASNFLPLNDRDYLIVGEGRTKAEVAKFSQADADALEAYNARLEAIADVLRDLVLKTPPNLEMDGGVPAFAEMLKGAALGRSLARLDVTARRDLLALFSQSAGDWLDGWFESEPIKAAFGFDGIVGNYASPYSPGTAYVLLHHVFGEVNGRKGVWGHAIGGMGAITQAMAAACREAGVDLRTEAPVAEVTVEQGRATGVRTQDGEYIAGRTVVSNLNPKLLFGALVDPIWQPLDFRERIARYRCGSGTFRMNVALSRLPRFTCLPEPGDHLTGGIIIAPTLAYMERAYADARAYGWSRRPIVELLIPSTLDASLAPQGRHVASLFCQHVAPVLPGGRSWDDHREEVADLMIDTVDRCAPGFRTSVLGRQALSPLDLERTFGLVGGDIMHGALSLDQMFSARPVLGHGHYRTPVRGLYQCGGGHPPRWRRHRRAGPQRRARDHRRPRPPQRRPARGAAQDGLTLRRALAPAPQSRDERPMPIEVRKAGWREPLDVLSAFAERPFAFALLSGGGSGERWSYLGRAPSTTFSRLTELRTGLGRNDEDRELASPPFCGGAVGLAAYEWSAVLEARAPQRRRDGWPDLTGGVYDAVLAFDHSEREVLAVGRGADASMASRHATEALALLEAQPQTPRTLPGGAFERCAWDEDYPAAVLAVMDAIAAGEIFQANIARGWRGRLARDASPFDLLRALLSAAPAPFAGYLRLPGRALVSHSPERFLQVSAGGHAVTRPIKGTRPRSGDPATDSTLAAELLASAKDRAENLMIVDLMRNDLARGCRPGSVKVDGFCELESFANVHHLVSSVSGMLKPGVSALDLFASAFPPGSVTGAPKLQAMQVIARHEPPRGPYCGSLFRAGYDGAFDSSVLIRSVALEQDGEDRWRWEARAGAGITAGSDPLAEDAEAEAKIATIRAALTGAPCR